MQSAIKWSIIYRSMPVLRSLNKSPKTYIIMPDCYCCSLCSHVQLFFNLMDSSPPGPLSMGFFQARTLEWVAISSSRGSSWARYQTFVSWTGRRTLYHWQVVSLPGKPWYSLQLFYRFNVIAKSTIFFSFNDIEEAFN